jgi:peptidoglycan/LPS O-acetylase OafA/YrhL
MPEADSEKTVIYPRPGAFHPWLDGLRGIAALFVVLHHAWLQTWPKLVYPDRVPHGLMALLTNWLLWGHFAVTFFIALSGFSLMLPVLRDEGRLKGGSPKFYQRRARRILPPYFAALGLSVLIAACFLRVKTGTLYDASLPVTGWGVVSHVLLMQDLFPALRAQINGPLWSVAAEVHIYVLFPLLVWVRRRWGFSAMVLFTAPVSLRLASVFRGTPYESLTPQYLLVFVLGMYAAEEAFRLTAPQYLVWRNRFFTAIGVVASAFAVIGCRRWGFSLLERTDTFVGLASMCLLVLAVRRPGGLIRRIAEWRLLVWVGGFSYSLYLIHFPLQQLLWQWFVAPLGLSETSAFWVTAGIGTPILVLLSFAFYRVFERPFMNLNRRLGGRFLQLLDGSKTDRWSQDASLQRR